MGAERKLEEIPKLQSKLAMVNEIQTETQKQLLNKTAQFEQVQKWAFVLSFHRHFFIPPLPFFVYAGDIRLR